MTPAVTSALRLEDRWALVDGIPVFHRSGGAPDGPPMLHLHGFAISGRYMLPTATLLADRYRTWVPDLPGFGRSPRPPSDYTIDGLADTVAGFLDEIGEERVTVVANSLGCVILGALATRHRDRVAGAVMVSPAGGPHSQPLPRAVWQLMSDAPREPLSMGRLAVPDYLHFGVAETFALFRAMTRYPSLQTLLGLDVPLLVVAGGRDPLLPKAQRIREVLLQVQGDRAFALVKQAAHAINYSHPRELASLVDAFVTGTLQTGYLPESDADGPLSPVVVVHRR